MPVLCLPGIQLLRCNRSLSRSSLRLSPVSPVSSRCSRASASARPFPKHPLSDEPLQAPHALRNCPARHQYHAAPPRNPRQSAGESYQPIPWPHTELGEGLPPEYQRPCLHNSCAELRKRWTEGLSPLPGNNRQSRSRSLSQAPSKQKAI